MRHHIVLLLAILLASSMVAAATTTAESSTTKAAATTTKKITTAAKPKTTAASADPTDAASSQANVTMPVTSIDATSSSTDGFQQTQIPIITQVYGSGGAQLALGSGGFILAVSLALAFAQ
ncbi:hypothetical protein BC943DRAFT_321983 [Umbelopsis sp. AD052]|nr:hypothetical protein BC943DRAFT_321983 [Umbelopsis sp. AD052]